MTIFGKLKIKCGTSTCTCVWWNYFCRKIVVHSNDRPCLLFPGQIMMWVLVLYFGSLALLIQSLYSPSPLGSLRFFKIPWNLLTIFVNYNEFVWIFFEDPRDFQVINRKSAVLYINVTGVSNNLTFYGLVHGVKAHWSDQMYIKHKIYLAQDVVMWAGFPWSVYDMYSTFACVLT